MTFDRELKINLLIGYNPKRGASERRFQFYFDLKERGVPFTVGDYVDRCCQAGISAGKAQGDLRWDRDHNFIRVEEYEQIPFNRGAHKTAAPKGIVKSEENLEESSPLMDAMADSWFGYGCWKAPFWFIGPEQGGNPNDSNHCGDAKAWDGMNRKELLDCKDHHKMMGNLLWHGERASIQFTWGAMIRILLALKGQEVTNQNVLSYQKNFWGSSAGETAVIELFGGRAKSMKIKNKYRTTPSKLSRIEKIRDRFLEHQPRVVIFYGISNKRDYEKILGTSMDNSFLTDAEPFIFSGKNGAPFAKWGKLAEGPTVGICVYHPSQHGTHPPDSDWILLGKRLKELT